MNVICISGRLCHTPELRQTTNGKRICTFCVAVDRPYVRNTSDFFYVVAWDNSAEYIARAHVGDLVMVNGCLTSRSYTDSSGLKRTAIEIKADDISVSRKQDKNAVDAPLTELCSDSDLPF